MSDRPRTGTGAAGRAMDLASLRAEIERLESEADRIHGKLQALENYTDGQGKVDNFAYRKDEHRLGEIDRQVRRLERQAGEVREKSTEWTAHANKRAADFLRGRLPRIPEEMRTKVRDEFIENFRALTARGTFENPAAQSDEQIDALIRDRFENAVGRIYASNLQQRKPQEGDAPPRDDGIDDESNPPAPPPEDDGFGDDTLARELYNDYVPPRQRQARTLADVQREQRQAAMARDQANEQRQGQGQAQGRRTE